MKTLHLSTPAFCFALLAGLSLHAAQAQTSTSALITERSISTDAALTVAQTALAHCRANGYRVSVTVLGRQGRHIVQLSDDSASPHTVENSLRKAYTAYTTRNPSGELGKRPPQALASFLLLQQTTGMEGGLPIFSGTEIVGSVGVSGAPGGDKDAACGQAGINSVASQLGN